MLISLEAQQKANLEQDITEGKVVSGLLERDLVYTERRHPGWDGYLHPSCLDWNSPVESQLKKLQKEFNIHPAGLQRMKVGSLVHEFIQDFIHTSFFNGNSHVEEHIEDHELLFRGTPDQWGEHCTLGTVVFEYKSISSYQSDAISAKTLRILEPVLPLLPEDYLKRLKVKYIQYTEPKSDHLTQAFTYAFMMKRKYGKLPDWVCICYIRKETLGTIEFWLNVPKHLDLVKKAWDNYKAVYKAVKLLGMTS